MPKKNRSLSRDDGPPNRDASLIIIASEDHYAVKQYFFRFFTSRIRVKVLETTDGRSSPEALVSRLDEFKKRNVTEANDQFWICIDQDHWTESSHISNLTRVLQHCRNSGYQVAISNPCFELWLLLHYSDVDPAAVQNASDVNAKLAASLGGYNKTKCCTSMKIERSHLDSAVMRAKAMDSTLAIPNSPTTRMYQIVEQFLYRGDISFRKM